ncbi:glycosyltransferase [Idiomarina piscisalsi]|uniref:Glycosyl transferase family 1 domain-containing protein n=1 Tax=Idiomarina piscisalsi TaxID=1096243 RepID=A0A432YEL8_9GAMM|nr:glycosyltransferase [Idiomarina piscisalsi]RUO59393.1 hypothetical protein CWI73_12500 [Idiomarina piscisalsi]
MASDVAPHLEVFDAGSRAWLFKKGDAESFKTTLEAMLNASPEVCAEKTKAALAAVNKQYVWKKSLKPLLDVLKESVQGHRLNQ